MQNHEFGLSFLTLEVIVTHISQILECLINVTHTDPTRNWRGRQKEERRIEMEKRRGGRNRETKRDWKEEERNVILQSTLPWLNTLGNRVLL